MRPFAFRVSPQTGNLKVLCSLPIDFLAESVVKLLLSHCTPLDHSPTVCPADRAANRESHSARSSLPELQRVPIEAPVASWGTGQLVRQGVADFQETLRFLQELGFGGLEQHPVAGLLRKGTGMRRLRKLGDVVRFILDEANHDLLRFRLTQDWKGGDIALRAANRIEERLASGFTLPAAEIRSDLVIAVSVAAWTEFFDVQPGGTRATPRTFQPTADFVKAAGFVKNALIEARPFHMATDDEPAECKGEQGTKKSDSETVEEFSD